jgi:hypothetical protein
MKKLERAILMAMNRLPKRFAKMSGGERLSRAPEYLLNAEIGYEISRALDYTVLFESTLGQTRKKRLGRAGRKKGNSKKFDITIWDGKQIRAVIELKRVNTLNGAYSTIVRDREKIAIALNAGIGLKVGYLLIHSEAPNSQERKSDAERLEKRFNSYLSKIRGEPEKLKATRVNVLGKKVKHHTARDSGGQYWWGFALVRLQPCGG